jgi:transcriptional regulator with XRE-family HTH domain
MQAFQLNSCNACYNPAMRAGRPAQSERTEFGERLYRLREQRGLSQKLMAEKLGITQQSYAAWERRHTALRPAQLASLAKILECSVDELVGIGSSRSRRVGGPPGRIRRMFEAVTPLPRHQQNKVAEFVEAFVAQHANGAERR